MKRYIQSGLRSSDESLPALVHCRSGAISDSSYRVLCQPSEDSRRMRAIRLSVYLIIEWAKCHPHFFSRPFQTAREQICQPSSWVLGSSLPYHKIRENPDAICVYISVWLITLELGKKSHALRIHGQKKQLKKMRRLTKYVLGTSSALSKNNPYTVWMGCCWV